MHFSLEMKYNYKVNKAIYHYRLQMFVIWIEHQNMSEFFYGCKNYSNPYKDEDDKNI